MSKKLDSNTVGGRIRALRQKNGLTQEELAQKLHIEKSTIAKMELGVTEPTYSKVIAYAAALNTTVDYLLGNTNGSIQSDGYSNTIFAANKLMSETNEIAPVKELSKANPKMIEILNLLYRNKDNLDDDDWRLLLDNISNYIHYLSKK